MNNTKSISLQRRKTDLTIEEVRALPGYENLTEEEAESILQSIKELSLLIYEVAIEKNIRICFFLLFIYNIY